MPKDTGRLHLPDILYGGIDNVANQIDELGSDATITELSCALVNACRQIAANIRTIDTLAQRVVALESLDARVLELERKARGMQSSIELLSGIRPGEFGR